MHSVVLTRQVRAGECPHGCPLGGGGDGLWGVRAGRGQLGIRLVKPEILTVGMRYLPKINESFWDYCGWDSSTGSCLSVILCRGSGILYSNYKCIKNRMQASV